MSEEEECTELQEARLRYGDDAEEAVIVACEFDAARAKWLKRMPMHVRMQRGKLAQRPSHDMQRASDRIVELMKLHPPVEKQNGKEIKRTRMVDIEDEENPYTNQA